MLYRKALATRNMDRELTDFLSFAVESMNFIKTLPTKARQFAMLGAEMGVEHDGSQVAIQGESVAMRL